MFELNDYVTFYVNGVRKVGQIILWYYDEGNIWTVQCGNETFDCNDHELSPANDAYGHSYCK